MRIGGRIIHWTERTHVVGTKISMNVVGPFSGHPPPHHTLHKICCRETVAVFKLDSRKITATSQSKNITSKTFASLAWWAFTKIAALCQK